MQRIFITVFVVLLCIAGASAQSSNKLVAASAARGKTIYLQRCMVCHQADGGGVPKLNAPLDGEFYENAMPAAADLTDQQIADVLTFIRNSWTNKAGPVTTLQVKQIRSKLK
jgi:mono/diheme cytochrome c family protein